MCFTTVIVNPFLVDNREPGDILMWRLFMRENRFYNLSNVANFIIITAGTIYSVTINANELKYSRSRRENRNDDNSGFQLIFNGDS